MDRNDGSGKTKLDWSKLLGFDQIVVGGSKPTTINDPRLSKIGGKNLAPPRSAIAGDLS